MPSPAETRFEQYVLDRGLVTEDELRQGRLLLAQTPAENRPANLPTALVRIRAMTESQARRIWTVLKEETASPGVTLNIPGIQLMEKMGRGSQAVVYKGKQLSVDRIVAVKVLLSEQARDPQAKQRFLQEAKAAARLSHNNIVQAIDAGETAEGFPYFVMEVVDPPRTVGDLLKDAGGPLEEPQAVAIATQIAEALAHAHSRGFLHRDVKPKNIMITPDGRAKLADMGLARHVGDSGLDEVGKAFGTPYYIAPEQVLGSPNVDFRADIYSLGATLYEMLTGRPPFAAPTPQQIMNKHVTATLTPPDHINAALSAGVSEVVEVMMSKRPQDRYKSTEDLLVDLKSVAAGEPPRIARDRVGMGAAVMEGLAQGEGLPSESPARPPAPPVAPFAVNQLTIILFALLAASLLVIVLLAVM